jgi:hypothetical protein
MIMFRLYRHRDKTGVSGTGYVAEGMITSYGIVMMQWFGPHGGVGVFNNKEDMLAVHGHDGDTVMEFSDYTGRHSGEY